MNNPVTQALARARQAEQDQHERELAARVAARLGLVADQRDASEWSVWQAWCLERSVTSFPARPAMVAFFILDSAALSGIDRLLKVIEAISAAHEGIADPTLGPVVAEALNYVAPIPPPRSWAKEEKRQFILMPRSLQEYVLERETDRDKALLRAMNEAKRKEKPASVVTEKAEPAVAN